MERPGRLPDHLSDILEIYGLLADSRPICEGAISGITTTDILAAAAAFGFDPEAFLRKIRALDRIYIERFHEQAAQADPTQKK